MRARRSMTTYSNYSCTRIPVDGPPTRVRVSGSLLALLTYEYPGGYGLKSEVKLFDMFVQTFLSDFVQNTARGSFFFIYISF